MHWNVSYRSAEGSRSFITIVLLIAISNQKTSCLNQNMYMENLCPWSSWLISDLALKKSSWKLLQAPKSTLHLNRLNFIIILMLLMYGLLESFWMKFYMVVLSILVRITRKCSIKFWKCLLRSGIKAFEGLSKSCLYLFSRKNLMKDRLSLWSDQQCKKSLNRSISSRKRRILITNLRNKKKVNLVTSLIRVDSFLKIQVMLSWILWTTRKIIWCIRVGKFMRVGRWRGRKRRNYKRLGNLI